MPAVPGWLKAACAGLFNSGAAQDTVDQDGAAKSSADDRPTGPAPANPFEKPTAQLRDVAKWLIGALAAVAAVLLAGSQLTSLGSVSTTSPWRLGVAAAAAVVAVVAAVVAIYQLSTVLPMQISGLDGVVESSAHQPMAGILARDIGFTEGRADVATLVRDYRELQDRYFTADQRLAAAQQQLDQSQPQPTPAATLEHTLATKEEARVGAQLAVLRDRVQLLAQMTNYYTVLSRFEQVRSRVLQLSAVAAVAIVTFAWAANPADPPSGTGGTVLNDRPVAATLFLTDAGAARFGGELGSACVRRARSAGVQVLALAARDSTVEVVVVPEPTCPSPSRLSVDSTAGYVVASARVTPPPAKTPTKTAASASPTRAG